MSKGLHVYEYCWEIARVAARLSDETQEVEAI
jgi:hypothetical protein